MRQSMIGWIAEQSAVRKCASIYQATKDAATVFTNKYQIIHANTDSLKKAAYSIRHEVYCRELQYENTAHTGMETDAYDVHSDQILLLNEDSQRFVGCVRLVHGRTQDGNFLLPFEKTCGENVDSRLIRMVKESGEKYVEVSRLAIAQDFRNRERADIADLGEKKTRVASGGVAMLYLGIQAYARTHDVKYLFAIVQERLLRSMHRLSIPAIQIGQAVEHRGARVPIMIETKDVERIMPLVLKPKYRVICDTFAQSDNSTL